MPDLAALGPIELATYGDIEHLMTRRVREGMRLDYKASVFPLNDKARFELVKDVSAFANTEGGILVTGVKQHADGSIAELTGMPLDDDDDAVLNRLSAIIADNVDERIPGISLRIVRSEAGLAFLLVRVPRSPLGPHMITMPTTYPRFYYRANTINAPMTAVQVKRASLVGSQREHELLELIERRMQAIGSAESSVHIFALPLYSEKYSLDLTREAVIRGLYTVSGAMGAIEARHTLAGFIVRSTGGSQRTHVLFMRDGGVELYDSPLAHRNNDQVPVISLHLVERRCRELINALSHAHIDGLGTLPLLVAVKLSGVRGARYVGAYNLGEGSPCTEDEIFPEPVILHDWTDADRALKHTFDVMWQAFGVAKSPNYDETGARKTS